MIKEKTVFILGAGASFGTPSKYPIGTDLRDKICQNLDGNHQLVQQIAKAVASEVEDLPDYVKAVEEFRRRFYGSGQFTIDAFIEHNNDRYGKIAKCAIAQVLLNYEIESALTRDLNNNWYAQLFKIMRTDYPENYHQNSASFITFNYDLSLDQYFYNALLYSCASMTEEQVKSILQNIPIIHVYGQLGELSWQGGDYARRYGDRGINEHQFKNIANGIQTVFDNVDTNQPKFKRMAELIGRAENIYFIGFGFDEFNFNRLPFPRMKGKKVIGTCLGIEKANQSRIIKYFEDYADSTIQLVSLTALDFILKTTIN